ncbi:MAG: C-GCAxxG-C-C family protein [Leptonema sp. (in: bacteria)]
MEEKILSTNPKEKVKDIITKSKETNRNYVKSASDSFVFGSDNCSEAIATAIAKYENLPELELKKYVSGFGKGIAGKAMTCGALLTGICFISKFATEKGYTKKEIRQFASKFYDQFSNEFGSNICKELSGHDCDEAFQQDFDLHTCGVYIAYTTNYVLEFEEQLKQNQEN